MDISTLKISISANHFVFALFGLIAISCSNQNKANSNPDKKEALAETNTSSKTDEKNKKILISELSNSSLDILPTLVLNQLKGKVVYVDIWATWCRPCLAEVPYSKILESKFEGKNISFITLCCASKQDVWEKTIKDLEIPGEHHLLNESQCMNLRDKYQLVAFPTYMVFDKKGNLLYNDAPRPSSNEIEGILNELLEK